MKFVDPRPPSSPSIEEQSDALHKGLGRTMQWALAAKLDDEPLLQACCHDLRFDVQVECSRGPWLWQLIRAVNGVQRFHAPLLHELKELPDRRSADQLCELAYFYAAMGEQDFRERLYEIVEQNDAPDGSRVGEDEILRLDGKDAFVFTARVRGKRLENHDWDWDDGSFISDAVELLGEDQVSKLLENTTDKSLNRFHERWRAEEKIPTDWSPQHSHQQRMEAITVAEVIAAAEGERPAYWTFRGWGMYASDDDLKTVLKALWAAKHPQVIINYLSIFSNRALPAFDVRVIEFCNHPDEQVRQRAFNALQMNSHPWVREFAIAKIKRDGLRDPSCGALLIRNYAAGDEHLMLDALELPEDKDKRHWLLMDMIKVLENNTQADPSKLAVVVYAYTPCENCRFYAAKLLHSHKLAPGWMPGECQFDSYEPSRSLFSDTTSEPSSAIPFNQTPNI